MSDTESSKEMAPEQIKHRTRRAFLVFFGMYGLGLAAWEWILTRAPENDTSWPFRRMLRLNEKIWRGLFSSERTAPKPAAPAPGTVPRANGDEGLGEDFDVKGWRLQLGSRSIPLEEIQALPRTETTALFKCIEGWSQVVSYAGVRFSDFAKHYKVGTRSGGEPDLKTGRSDLYSYVGLKTPDGGYYVSIDVESAWHPDTILAYEMNGKPLALQNGAPLRLIIPVKYGVKSLKRVGSIFFSDERPPDYWYEQGYDWYAGL